MVASLTVHASTNLASSVLSMARPIVGMKSSKSTVCCLLRLILRCTIIRSGKLGQCHKWQQTYAELGLTASDLGKHPFACFEKMSCPFTVISKSPRFATAPVTFTPVAHSLLSSSVSKAGRGFRNVGRTLIRH